jgi:Domain of Unknown Function (DUF1206)
VAVAEAKQAAKGPWVEWAGRLGLVAKGAIYAIVGLLAIAVPLGLGGKASDRQGALRTVAEQRYGEALLIALAVGFAGYAIWRFVEAFLDRDNEGSGPKALAKRLGYFGRGLIYAGSCFVAVALVVGAGSGGGDERKETAKLLDLPLGRWIVGAVGLGFLAAGAYNLYRSLTKKFRKDLREHEMRSDVRSWAIAVGVFGHAARGVVFGLIGLFLLKAAIEYDPKEAIGLDGALRKLAQQTYGEWLLGLTAAGLVAYALFCIVQARYREV